MSFSISIDDCTHIRDKAKTKPDGIWAARGYKYAVKNGRLIALADRWGGIAEFVGIGVRHLGDVKPLEASKELKKMITNP